MCCIGTGVQIVNGNTVCVIFCYVAFCVSMHDQTYLSLQMEMLISGPSFHRITECTVNIV